MKQPARMYHTGLLAGLLPVVLAVILAACQNQDAAPKPEANTPALSHTGQFHFIEEFTSSHVDARNITIWLPPGYEAGDQHYPVIYASDGPNLFDGSHSYGGEWGLDEVMQKMVLAGKINPAIIVGIWQTKKRWAEYMPYKVFALLPEKFQQGAIKDQDAGQPVSDNYVRFVVEDVKPMIDAKYRTKPDQKNTYHLGSSMGGLISLYMVAERPDVFAGCACISTHWPLASPTWPSGEDAKSAMRTYLQQSLLDPEQHKLWFDHGTETLDAYYAPYQIVVDQVLQEKGFVKGENLISMQVEGAGHDEASWNARAPQYLLYLLGSPQ